MTEQKSLQVPTETVTVLLSSKVVWQRVPDRRTHNSEGPTAECGEPMSWYVSLGTLPEIKPDDDKPSACRPIV